MAPRWWKSLIYGPDTARPSSAVATVAATPTQAKGYSIGGTNGAGGDFGNSWLNGAFEQAGLTLGIRDPYSVRPDQLIDNSAVMACVQWIMRVGPEAPVAVANYKPDRTMGDIIENHELAMLLEYPNEYYTGENLKQAIHLSYGLTGEGFMLKVRKGFGYGPPVELWYEPHFSIRPCGKGGMTTHYEIYRNGIWLPIPKEDVVHLKFAIDPRNPMRGLNPLAAALREIFIDQEALIYTATLMRNLGVTNMVVSPQKGDVIPNVEDLARLIIAKTTGAHKGEPLVWSDPLDVAYPPTATTDNIAAREIHTIPEERVCSLLGLNRMAVGLGSDPKFTNMKEAREAAVEENLLPTFRLLSQQLNAQLLPDFTGVPAKQSKLGVFFVTSAMRVLADDMDALSVRVATEFDGGFRKLNEARLAVTLDKDTGPFGELYKWEIEKANRPAPTPPPVMMHMPGAQPAPPAPQPQPPAQDAPQDVPSPEDVPAAA